MRWFLHRQSWNGRNRRIRQEEEKVFANSNPEPYKIRIFQGSAQTRHARDRRSWFVNTFVSNQRGPRTRAVITYLMLIMTINGSQLCDCITITAVLLTISELLFFADRVLPVRCGRTWRKWNDADRGIARPVDRRRFSSCAVSPVRALWLLSGQQCQQKSRSGRAIVQHEGHVAPCNFDISLCWCIAGGYAYSGNQQDWFPNEFVTLLRQNSET